MPSIKNSFKPSPSPKMTQIGGQAPGLVDDFKTGKVVETIELNAQKTNSTTVITNLNADLLDGDHAAAFAVAAHTHVLTAGATDVTSTATELNVLDGIPATLTFTEIGYCDGVTSAIQTQIDGKAATVHTHALAAGATDVTATAAEVNYIDGVTSAIQTQIDGKEPTLTKYNLAGTANQITLSASGTGAILANNITLSLPQDIATASSPQFANLVVTAGGDIKPSANSVSAINIAQADGTNFVSFDTTNKQVLIGSNPDASSSFPLDIYKLSTGTGMQQVVQFGVGSDGTPAAGEGVNITFGIPYTAGAGVQVSAGYIGVIRPDATVGNYGGHMVFGTRTHGSATAERMRIDTDGNVGIGMSPAVQFELSGSVGQKASGTTWSNPSDKRLKENISPFTDGLNVITKINPVNYELNGLGGTTKGIKGISVIAQDILEVAPYTIDTYKAKLNADDEEETELYRFEASALIFALINSVKELLKRIEILEQT